jgi:hypothetical protein
VGEGRYRKRKQMSREKENIVRESKCLERRKISRKKANFLGERRYRRGKGISWEKEDIVRESKCLERKKLCGCKYM